MLFRSGYTINCTVSPQGTSTLADYIKNIDIEFDEQAVAPFPMVGEWIDGVVFQMVEP